MSLAEAAKILVEFGYEPAWVEATFMRDGAAHPAFRMAEAIYLLRREHRVAPVVNINFPSEPEWPEAEGAPL